MKNIRNILEPNLAWFKSKHLPINLQMFAEDDGKGGEPNPPKTYSSDEYDKLKGEYDKLKGSFDKTSSEIAELKKQLKAKQTDEEKKAEEEKNKNTELEQLKTELATMKIKSKLATDFEEKEVEELTKLIIANDVEGLTGKLVEFRKAFKTKVYEQAKEEFQHSANLPGGGGSGEKQTPKVVQDYIDNNKGKGKGAKDYFGLGNNNAKQN